MSPDTPHDLDAALDALDVYLPPPPPRVLPGILYGAEIGELGIGKPEWLWKAYLAFGTLAVLDGDPGVGKSLLTIDLAARLGRGLPLPDGRPSPPNPVRPQQYVPTLFVNAEDEVRRTVLPRIAAAGGNLALAIFLGGVGESDNALRLPDDFPLLEAP